MNRIELPPLRHVSEHPAPVMLEVWTGNRYLGSLEEMKGVDQVRSYSERSVFTIDDATGLFMAETPYGTYAYHWPHRGRDVDMFTFLASLHFDYFMGKASKQPYRELDLERTIKEMRAELVRDRRERSLKKDQARDLWSALTYLEAECPRTDEEFFRLWWNDHALTTWYDGGDPPSTYGRDTFSARHFWDVIWQALIASEPFRSRMAVKAAAA